MYDFRFTFMPEDEFSILKEVNQLGLHNYIETTMSLRSIDVKKNLEVLTREYNINNIVRSAYEFLTGELLDY
jgi:hypothetical protein